MLIEQWADVEAINEDDLAPFNTVVVDTAGRASAHTVKSNPKMGRGGALTLQGYRELKQLFETA